MAFRRGFRRSRRRSLFDMQSFLLCRTPTFMNGLNPCSDPLTVAFPIVTGSGLQVQPIAKGVVFGGTHFSSELSINPANSIGIGPTQVTDLIEVYEAICLLPLADESTSVPAFIPRLTNAQTDATVDILWKRISVMPFWGTGVIPSSQLQSTIRDTAHGPQHVKAKRRVDDRHGIFHVFNFVSGLVFEPGEAILIVHDIWHRFAVKQMTR